MLPWFSVRHLSAWVPRSCGVHGLHDGVTCLRSGLCSSSVRDRNEDFPSWWVWFLALVRGSPASGWHCVLRPALVLEAIPPSHRLVLLLHTGFLFSGPGWCGRLQPFPSMHSFRMCTLWVNSVFVTLDHERRFGDCFFSDIATHIGVESSYSHVLLRFIGTSGGWWPRFYLPCHCSLPVGCLILAYSAA